MCVCRKHLREVNPECMGSVCVSTMNSHPTELQKERLTQHYGCGTPWVLFDWADSLSWFYHTCYYLKTGIFKFWWLLNLTQLQLAGVILQWSRVVICEQRLEHNRGVTLLQALEDHAASPRVHGGPCACAGAVSVFGWGLRLDKERPRLLLLWHFSNW